MYLKCLICLLLCLFLSVFLKNRVLSVLLCLETLVLVGVLVLVGHSELIFSVCFVRVGACERAVGLACLVSLVRAQGTSFIMV